MNISGVRKITETDRPVFPCELSRTSSGPWERINNDWWNHHEGTVAELEREGFRYWRPLSAPRPEGPPEGEALALEDDGPAIDLSQRLTASDQPAATEPRDIYHATGRSMIETGNALLAKDAVATEPPATGATPETDAAWEAAPPADHGGMTAMRRCSESLETRLHAAEAEVRRLTKKLADEESAHSATIGQRDEAEDAANELTARILGEPIDWSDHDAKWQEAIEAVTPEPEVDQLRAQLQTALAAQQKAEGERHKLTTEVCGVLQENADLREQVARLTEERDALAKKQPINTHRRLFDLVRYMRSELHAADLINEDEYAWLCQHEFKEDKGKPGSPSPRRLEDYAALRAKLALADGLAEAVSFYAGRLRSDGNGYEFDKEPSGINGGVARAAIERYRAASVPPAATTEEKVVRVAKTLRNMSRTPAYGPTACRLLASLADALDDTTAATGTKGVVS